MGFALLVMLQAVIPLLAGILMHRMWRHLAPAPLMVGLIGLAPLALGLNLIKGVPIPVSQAILHGGLVAGATCFVMVFVWFFASGVGRSSDATERAHWVALWVLVTFLVALIVGPISGGVTGLMWEMVWAALYIIFIHGVYWRKYRRQAFAERGRRRQAPPPPAA